MTVVVESEAGGDAKRPVGRKVPGDDRREIVRGVMQAETVAVSKAAVHLQSGNEILGAKVAAMDRRLQAQRTADPEGIAKFPGLTRRDILGDDGVLGDVPTTEGFREQEFGFDFVVVLLAGNGIRVKVVGFDVVTFDLFEDLVSSAGVLVFDVENGVDKMLLPQEAEAVLPTETGEDSAVVEGGLSVEIDLGRPPCGGPVLELGPEGVEVVAPALGAKGGEVFDFETSRLLQIVVVGHDVGTFLGSKRESNSGNNSHQNSGQEPTAAPETLTASKPGNKK